MKHNYKKLHLSILFLFLSLAYGFAQSLSNISPATGEIGQTIIVSISGQGNAFGQGTSTTQVYLSNGGASIFAQQQQISGPDNLNATFTFDYTNPIGIYDVSVYNSISGFVVLTGTFTLNSASTLFSLSTISPDTSIAGQVINVSISGQGGSFGQTTSTTDVWFSQGSSTIYSDQVSIVNPNQLTAQFTIPNNSAIGGYDVNVLNSIDGPAMMPNGFTILNNPNPPSLSFVTPNNSDRGKTIDVTISGQNTHFGQGTSTTQAFLEQGGSRIYASVTVNNTTESSSISTGSVLINGGLAVKKKVFFGIIFQYEH